MKRIVIIGNSWSGIKIVEALRQDDPSWQATVFTLDNNLPYNRAAFPAVIGKKGEIPEAFLKPRGYFEKSNIVLSEEKLARVNFKKNAVFTEEKKPYEYDVLVIAATENFRLPEIKGVNKTGVTGLFKFKDIQQIFTIAPLAETVVVQGQDINCVKFVAALRKRNLETIFIPTAKSLAPLNEESSVKILQLLQEASVRVIDTTSIEEVLGDTEAKAIRLKSGKVIGCQLIILGDELPDLRLFKESGLEFQEKIVVDDNLKTNIPNVYACAEPAMTGPDGWTNFDNYITVLEYQAGLIAANITQKSQPLTVPAGEMTLEINGIPLIMAPVGIDKKQFELVAPEQISFDSTREVLHSEAPDNKSAAS